MSEMSEQELRDLPVTVDLVTAGRAFGLGRTKSHELARAGEFPCPVLRIGTRYRVRKTDVLREAGMPGQDGPPATEPEIAVGDRAPHGPAEPGGAETPVTFVVHATLCQDSDSWTIYLRSWPPRPVRGAPGG